MNRPNFFIVGAPKCGTTAFYSYLKGHPDVFLPSLKEPHFFAEDIFGSRRNVCTEEAYLALFERAAGKVKIGEASTTYLGSFSAARRIKAFNPASQIIVMLRNPIDMMYSLHSQRIYDAEEPLSDFGLALDADVEAGIGRNGFLIRPPGLGYRDVAGFSGQISRYFEAFGREKVYVIVYEEFKADPARVFRETLAFLGVRTDFRPCLVLVNQNRRARSKRVQRLLRTPPVGIRKVSHAIMPLVLRRAIGKSLIRLNDAVDPRPPMAPELRIRLEKEFQTEIENVSRLLNRDLFGWWRGESAPVKPSRLLEPPANVSR